jgi:hypothetical protein
MQRQKGRRVKVIVTSKGLIDDYCRHAGEFRSKDIISKVVRESGKGSYAILL